jgi:hypothetical protein
MADNSSREAWFVGLLAHVTIRFAFPLLSLLDRQGRNELLEITRADIAKLHAAQRRQDMFQHHLHSSVPTPSLFLPSGLTTHPGYCTPVLLLFSTLKPTGFHPAMNFGLDNRSRTFWAL